MGAWCERRIKSVLDAARIPELQPGHIYIFAVGLA